MTYEAPKARVEDIGADEYRDPLSLAQWTVWLLYAHTVVSLLAVASGILERQTLLGLDSGALGPGAAETSDQRQAMLGGAQIIVFVATGFFCLRWIHRMCHNARVRARYMQYTPGWSIGWYFIPIAYWWKPYQAMKEIWQESYEQAGPRGVEAGAVLGWWWALWIIANLLSNTSFRISLRASTIDALLTSNSMALMSDLLQVPLNLVFIMMVRRLTSMQEYAHENPQAQLAKADLRNA
jgi:hypothetical protein